MNFCIAKIDIDTTLRPDHGVLRVNVFAITADARLCAQRTLDNAKSTADQIVQKARQQADAITADAEQRTLDAMRSYQSAFDAQYAEFIQRAQPLVIQLALGLFGKLVLSMTERERVAATVTRLTFEAPTKLSEVMLHLHPSDVAHVSDIEWPIKGDPTLAPGTAVLIASSGEWRMNFPMAVDTLKASLLRRQHDPVLL